MDEHVTARGEAQDPDEDLRELVRINPNQGSFEEYKHVRDLIRSLAPCSVLVFGVGKDSRFWIEANAGGTTVFLEHDPRWIALTREQIPEVVVHQVSYPTRRTQWNELLHHHDRLLMASLPGEIRASAWDVVFVDSPQGSAPEEPGRMQSIYTASVLAGRARDGHVLVHDCDREVEQVYTDAYLRPERLLAQVHTLRHYLLRPGPAEQ